MQGLHRDRHDAKGFSRLPKFPSRNRYHAVGFEMLEVFSESFDGVKAVLA